MTLDNIMQMDNQTRPSVKTLSTKLFSGFRDNLSVKCVFKCLRASRSLL